MWNDPPLLSQVDSRRVRPVLWFQPLSQDGATKVVTQGTNLYNAGTAVYNGVGCQLDTTVGANKQESSNDSDNTTNYYNALLPTHPTRFVSDVLLQTAVVTDNESQLGIALGEPDQFPLYPGTPALCTGPHILVSIHPFSGECRLQYGIGDSSANPTILTSPLPVPMPVGLVRPVEIRWHPGNSAGYITVLVSGATAFTVVDPTNLPDFSLLATSGPMIYVGSGSGAADRIGGFFANSFVEILDAA